MAPRRIYLDHAATTPIHAAVQEAMLPWLTGEYGNPSSLYQEGRRAKDAIDEAREIVTGLLGCAFGEVVFTSSGTEAANLAIVGAALAHQGGVRRRILFGASEHHAVLNTRPILERLGFAVELLPVDAFGRVDIDSVPPIGDDVLLVSLMRANNELGTIQEVGGMAAWCRHHGVLLHCDIVQSFGWLEEDVQDLNADLISLSAHKIQGPKGVGLLYLRAGVKPTPIIVGGGQEREQRAGTENVAGIVGFGVACKVLDRSSAIRTSMAHDAFLEALVDAVRSVPEEIPSLPGHAHVRFPGAGAESLLIALDRVGVAASAGAACSSGSIEPSHVLLACGWPVDHAKEGMRFTFGHDATVDDAYEAAERVNAAVEQVSRGSRGRGYSPNA